MNIKFIYDKKFLVNEKIEKKIKKVNKNIFKII
jgi:hypothetical protein